VKTSTRSILIRRIAIDEHADSRYSQMLIFLDLLGLLWAWPELFPAVVERRSSRTRQATQHDMFVGCDGWIAALAAWVCFGSSLGLARFVVVGLLDSFAAWRTAFIQDWRGQLITAGFSSAGLARREPAAVAGRVGSYGRTWTALRQ